MGAASLTENLVKALNFALDVKNGNPLPADVKQKCCREQESLSYQKIKTANCGDFVMSVLSCGYRLNGENKRADQIINKYKNTGYSGFLVAVQMAKDLKNFGWKPIYYDRDTTKHVHQYMRSDYTSAEQNSLVQNNVTQSFGEDIRWSTHLVLKGKAVKGMEAQGAVINFAPWDSTPGFVKPQSAEDLERVVFSWGMVNESNHNFILASDVIYHGSRGWTDVPRQESGFVNYIANRSTYGWYTASIGWIMLPPDTSIPTSMVNDLNWLKKQKNIPPAVSP